MSLLAVLQKIGVDAKKLAGWLDDGLKIASGPVELAFPAVTPWVTVLEDLLDKIDPADHTEELVQTLATALASVPPASLAAVAAAIEKAIAVHPPLPHT